MQHNTPTAKNNNAASDSRLIKTCYQLFVTKVSTKYPQALVDFPQQQTPEGEDILTLNQELSHQGDVGV